MSPFSNTFCAVFRDGRSLQCQWRKVYASRRLGDERLQPPPRKCRQELTSTPLRSSIKSCFEWREIRRIRGERIKHFRTNPLDIYLLEFLWLIWLWTRTNLLWGLFMYKYWTFSSFLNIQDWLFDFLRHFTSRFCQITWNDLDCFCSTEIGDASMALEALQCRNLSLLYSDLLNWLLISLKTIRSNSGESVSWCESVSVSVSTRSKTWPYLMSSQI